MDVERVKQAAVEAGQAIMAVRHGASLDIRHKSEGPVTAADLAANRLLHERLVPLAPDAGWLSEETADSADRLDRERCWVVDPLDGTHEFISGTPWFAVSIGLVEAGHPVLGVIYLPAKDLLYWGARGQGAWSADGPLEASRRASDLRLAVRYADLKRPWLHALRQHEPTWTAAPYGSTVAKVLRVARGVSDAYPAVTLFPYEWDVCAAHLLLEEAGGRLTDLEGKHVSYNRPDPRLREGVLASNGAAHDLLLERLQPILKG